GRQEQVRHRPGEPQVVHLLDDLRGRREEHALRRARAELPEDDHDDQGEPAVQDPGEYAQAVAGRPGVGAGGGSGGPAHDRPPDCAACQRNSRCSAWTSRALMTRPRAPAQTVPASTSFALSVPFSACAMKIPMPWPKPDRISVPTARMRATA